MPRSDFIQDATYAGNFGRYRKVLNRFLDHDPAMFELPKQMSIGDIGCGYGDLLLEMKSGGYTDLAGVEPDAECRKEALRQGLRVTEGTLTHTELADRSFDAVIVNAVFHHIDQYELAADELHRVLKDGGLLCFLEPAPTRLRLAMDFLTFKTPIPNIIPLVKTRYDVMKLEMITGLYPMFIREQTRFHDAIDRRFDKIWHRESWFFQFGKYRRR